MKLERVRPMVVRVTLHAVELAALMSCARWVAEGSPGELPADAVRELRQILEAYDGELARRMRIGPRSHRGGHIMNSVVSRGARYAVPGVAAGMAMATWAMAIAAFHSRIWAPPQGVAQAIGLGHPGHDFQLVAVLVGVVLHTVNAALIGALFVAAVRRARLHEPVALVGGATVYGFAVYGVMSRVVLRGIVSAHSASFLTAIPEWAWAVAHGIFGITLGMVTVWALRRDRLPAERSEPVIVRARTA